MEYKVKGTPLTAAALCVCVAAVCWFTAQSFMEMWKPDVIYPTPDFEAHMLSEWEPALKGTHGDTPVYIQKGEAEGGTVFIMGGTHPNEPSGPMAALMYLERAKVKQGRMIVMPFANLSATTHNSPQDAAPQHFTIQQKDGKSRVFKYGSRATNPIDQWPEPDVYIHYPSQQKLDGGSRSNLNRSYPGTKNDGLTQLVGLAVIELLKKENVDIAFDLHEASPEYPVINAIVAHENSMELAAMVCMELEMNEIPMRLEPSPVNFRGLSHREWGDSIPTLMPILMESGNPAQGRLRGRTNEALVLTGRDKAYAKAAQLGVLFIPYVDSQTLELRTARHVTAVKTFLDLIGEVREGKDIVVENIPSYDEIISEGLGAFLAVAPDAK
ncbi:MAG: succinylglutamate desuccinylase/aspartoacylase family protein [Pyramidobacter sp.]|nr:succinylglutamate desuccinylase/aspartoacylase family protein [Pyramidobacter sp.]